MNKNTRMPDPRRGDFFAVDRRAWAKACELGIGAAIAYLVLARGSGPDQRTTSWSVNAIENHTGVGRPRAQRAIDALSRAGLLRVVQKGSRPRYYIQPAHEVPDCEAYRPPGLNAAEQKVFDYLASGNTWLRDKPGREWDYRSPRAIAADLVQKRRARKLQSGHYAPIIYDAEEAVKPDWIWLPNSLVDGVAGEIDAPVELVRQTQNLAALRLLVELYHVQALASDGGIHWRGVRQEFTRHKLAERGASIVYGFVEGAWSAFTDRAPAKYFMTGEMEPVGQIGRERDRGWRVFWDAWEQLSGLGLFEVVWHVVEDDADDAEIIHPYALSCGEAAEQQVAAAAHDAAQAMLFPHERSKAEDDAMHLVVVKAHRARARMVGIARLRYRPRTSVTAAWLARMAEWEEMAAEYRALAEDEAVY